MKPSDVAFAADIDVRCWQSQQLSSTLSQSPQQGIQRSSIGAVSNRPERAMAKEEGRLAMPSGLNMNSTS